MADHRPDPDVLLAQAQADAASRKQGSLKVYFGYAAGVGKTYAMLENAHRAKALGRDVVVGYVEPHKRPETEALLSGLEAIPVRVIEYQGTVLQELDVDAALARRPDILLVDELAHTNAAGSRHQKRWQDVEELLDAGINVWTTLNVQHLESLNDIVSQITGVSVRETVPDHIWERADELELVDITPEELLARLQQGKIYVPEQAQRAIQRFFQRSNLFALRELSLRQAAQRIHTEVESARRDKAVATPWATAERLMVCIGPSPTTARVIRTAKRMAAAFNAPWLAVAVDLTGELSSASSQHQIFGHFQLAERLGAETATVPGQNIAGALLEHARSHNVTKILIGQTRQPRWKRLIFGTVVDEILEQCGEIDVYVIHGVEDVPARPTPSAALRKKSSGPYLRAAAIIAVAAAVAAGLRFLHVADSEANTVMLFLAAVAYSASRDGRGPAILASLLAVLIFDFGFVPPQFTFAVADAQYLVTFLVMLAIGLVISTLTSRLRAQVDSTRQRERRTTALYELGKQLSSLSGTVFLAAAAGKKIAEILRGEVVLYLKNSAGFPEVAFGERATFLSHPLSLPVAQWVIDHDQVAGAGTNTLPNALATFLPISGAQQTHGSIAIRVEEQQRLQDPDVRRLLEACASLLALAMERDQLAMDASQARIRAETEEIRSSLLSGVSHDLKTPLAAIAGASSSLLEASSIDEPTRRQLLETVAEEAARLNRLLENILQMSKLDAGVATPNRQWHVLEEIVGSALHRVRQQLINHQVIVHIPTDLPLLFVDGLLLEQVFVNLLENASRYTPAQTLVSVHAAIDGQSVRISVVDSGSGLPVGNEQRVFEKFYRASHTSDGGRGSGLGLAICRAIITAHGGTITASNRPSGGAEFVIQLPLPRDIPHVVVQ